MLYYGPDMNEVHLPFNFRLILVPWVADMVRATVSAYEAALPELGWPNWVLGNHDNPRIASRVGKAQARVAAMLLLTLRGAPTMYYGDEIGMHDVPIPRERVQDPFEKNVPGIGLGRDPERTPMQWDAGPNAGFAPPGQKPWLPIAEDHPVVNVAAQRDDAKSILTLTRRLISLRRSQPALSVGAYESVDAPEDVIAYLRADPASGTRFLVILNLASRPHMFWPTPGGVRAGGRVVLSTYLDREGVPAGVEVPLRADEGLIVLLDKR